jgi:MFS family permease
MQQLRGWSPVSTALAFLPAGLIVAVGAPRAGKIVDRFGTTRPIATAMLSFITAYALLLRLGVDSAYVAAILPSIVLVGVGFMLSYGPLNIAATGGVADHEQGLASGLVSTSFQVGGAVALAIVTAVINAGIKGSGAAAGSPAALLDGYHDGLIVSVVIATLGLVITLSEARVPRWSTRRAGAARSAQCEWPRLVDPAPVSSRAARETQQSTERSTRVSRCSGYARVSRHSRGRAPRVMSYSGLLHVKNSGPFDLGHNRRLDHPVRASIAFGHQAGGPASIHRA